jgi:hypothetical protein
MKKSEVKQQLKDGDWNYNDNDPYVIEFWENAVKFFPKEVAKDIQSLREFVKNDEEPYRYLEIIIKIVLLQYQIKKINLKK